MRLRAKIAALLVVLAVVVLVVGLTRGTGRDDTAGPDPAPAAPTVAASSAPNAPSSTPTPSAAPSSAGASTPANPLSLTADARRRWEPTVRGFGAAFTQKKLTSAQWRTALAPYAEAPVRTDLSTYDRQQVPDQRYSGYDVIDASDADVVVQVSYADGFALVLYLHTADQQQWLVHAYDRLEE